MATFASLLSFTTSFENCSSKFCFSACAAFRASASSFSRSEANSARALTASLRTSVPSCRARAASANIFFVSSCRLATMFMMGLKKKRARIQVRMRTLKVCSARVHQSMRMISTDKRICEQYQERDHQTVDCHCLDHRKADEQCARYRPRRFRLPRDGVHRGCNRSSLGKRRTDGAERNSDCGSEDADDLGPIHRLSPWLPPVLRSPPTALPMKTMARTVKI